MVGAIAAWAERFGEVLLGTKGSFRLRDGSVLSPDGAWISEARWNTLSRAEQQGHPPLCPAFLIEVLSINDARIVTERKMETWIANGAELAWIIDPYRATVSIYRVGRPVQVASTGYRRSA